MTQDLKSKKSAQGSNSNYSDLDSELSFYQNRGADRVSNDNANGGLASVTQGAIGFTGSSSHLLPGAVSLCVIAALSGYLLRSMGANGFLSSQVFWLLCGVGGLCTLGILLWGYMRKKTVGVWVLGDTIKFSQGVPFFRARNLHARDILSVKVSKPWWKIRGAAVLNVLLRDGGRLHIAGLQNAFGAEALISLQLASLRAQQRRDLVEDVSRHHWQETEFTARRA